MSASPTGSSPAGPDGRRQQDSDCESDSSEVLSVGHEPPPTLADLEPGRYEGRARTPSPASSDSFARRGPPSPPASSPGSSGALASPDARYAQPLLKFREPELDYAARLAHAGLGPEVPYPQRAAPPQPQSLLGVSVVMRLSLSPPSAMTAGLHPGLLRPPTLLLPHRLPVGQLLSPEEPRPPPPTPPTPPRNGSCAAAGLNGAESRRGNNGENLPSQGSLKFSIDNILKADFGRRITDPISLKKSRPKKPAARPIDLSKDFVESSSEGSERGSETSSTRNASPNLPSPAPSTTPASDAPGPKLMQWPAWVYCTRYSDRPSSGPRTRKRKRSTERPSPTPTSEEKRPRTAFSAEQLARLRHEFTENKYLTEQRRQALSKELGLNEAQIKIWFQNKRAKIKKASGQKNPLALQLMAQGLYNHSTVPLSKEEMEQAAELQAK